MKKRISRMVEVGGYGPVECSFVRNSHGWFCVEANGVKWDYRDWGAQAPMNTPEAAAAHLLSVAESYEYSEH